MPQSVSQPVRIACHGRNGHQIHRALKAGHPNAILTAISGFDDPEIPATVLRYDSLAALLAAGVADLVSVCSDRRSTQIDDVIACLTAGCHVYAEKPATLSMADLDHVLRCAQQHQRIFCEMNGSCDDVPFPDLRRLIMTEAIGDIFQITVQKSYPWHQQRPTDSGIDGGVALQVGVHVLRIAEYLLGPITQLTSLSTNRGDPGNSGTEMAASFNWQHASGVIGSGVANYGGAKEIGVWGNDAVRLFGAKGCIAWSAAEGCIRTWRRDACPEMLIPTQRDRPQLERVISACQGHLGDLPNVAIELHPTRLLLGVCL